MSVSRIQTRSTSNILKNEYFETRKRMFPTYKLKTLFQKIEEFNHFALECFGVTYHTLICDKKYVLLGYCIRHRLIRMNEMENKIENELRKQVNNPYFYENVQIKNYSEKIFYQNEYERIMCEYKILLQDELHLLQILALHISFKNKDLYNNLIFSLEKRIENIY